MGGILRLISFFEMSKNKQKTPTFYMSGKVLCSKENSGTQTLPLILSGAVGVGLKGNMRMFPAPESLSYLTCLWPENSPIIISWGKDIYQMVVSPSHCGENANITQEENLLWLWAIDIHR